MLFWRELVFCSGFTIKVDAGLINIPEGETADMDVVLSADPGVGVAVDIQVSFGDSGITVNGGPVLSLTFDSTDWDIPQTVTLSAAEDADTDNGSAIIICTSDDTDTVTITVAGKKGGGGGGCAYSSDGAVTSHLFIMFVLFSLLLTMRSNLRDTLEESNQLSGISRAAREGL